MEELLANSTAGAGKEGHVDIVVGYQPKMDFKDFLNPGFQLRCGGRADDVHRSLWCRLQHHLHHLLPETEFTENIPQVTRKS